MKITLAKWLNFKISMYSVCNFLLHAQSKSSVSGKSMLSMWDVTTRQYLSVEHVKKYV